MAKRRTYNHPTTSAWSASGSINIELSPQPITITRMKLLVRPRFTTTATPGTYNDPWDRIISSLRLTGKGQTYFDFTNLRATHHWTRFRRHAAKRPQPAASLTIDGTGTPANDLPYFFEYNIHFGVCPTRYNPSTGLIEDNPFDLSAGIPPVESGNLTLTGVWGAAAAPGSGWTITAGTLVVQLFGVQKDAGDPPALYLPMALPNFNMRTPTPTATSGLFATQDNVPAGDYLHSIMLMTTRGANAPRDHGVLGSLQVYDQIGAREILRSESWKDLEIMSQDDINGWPPSEDVRGTLGNLVVTHVADEGLVYLPLHRFATGGHPKYGADLTGLGTGDLQLRYGVANATTVTLDMLYTKYKLNPEHPANLPAPAAPA